MFQLLDCWLVGEWIIVYEINTLPDSLLANYQSEVCDSDEVQTFERPQTKYSGSTESLNPVLT